MPLAQWHNKQATCTSTDQAAQGSARQNRLRVGTVGRSVAYRRGSVNCALPVQPRLVVTGERDVGPGDEKADGPAAEHETEKAVRNDRQGEEDPHHDPGVENPDHPTGCGIQ